jgi:colanic acid/amylovoran biosynthesis glycosyltransferase
VPGASPIFGAVARIAYLLNQYPAISHSFILGEVRALRRRGVEVPTYSIHRSDPRHLLAPADREEHARTWALRPLRPGRLLIAHLLALLDHPLRYVSVLSRALVRSRGAPRALLWQLFYFAEAVALWQQIRQARPDHLHAHFAAPAADVAMIVAQLGDGRRPWSWSFSAHGADIDESDQRLLADKVRSAAAVVCVSDFGRSQLMVLVEPEQWAKIHVVRCGVDTRAFSPGPAAQAPDGSPGRPEPAPDGSLRLLAVGRLVAVKGHVILLEAIALALAQGTSVTLTLVGDGPLRRSLTRAAAQLGLEERVHFAGALGQDEIALRYRRADVLCLSSLREGIPVVLMEAMACALPVIATRITGIPELVEDERSGLLVAPGRPEALARAIVRLAGDPPLRRRLAHNGRLKVQAEYGLERSAAQLQAIFEEISG